MLTATLLAASASLVPVAELPVGMAVSHRAHSRYCARHRVTDVNVDQVARGHDALLRPGVASPSALKSSRSGGDRRLPARFIDDAIYAELHARGIPAAPPTDDASFLRRVSLDVAGRIPTVRDARVFLGSQAPDKRARLVRDLLASDDAIDHWTLWLRDLVGVSELYNTLAGRNATHAWLRDQVAAGQPVDAIVRGVLTAAGDGRGPGPQEMMWRWVEDPATYQDAYDNVAVNAVQRFLGVRALCISCHNGAGHLERVNTWLAERQRRQVWEMAAFWAHTGLEYHEDEDDPEDYWFVVFDVPGGNEYVADSTGGDRPPRTGGVIAPNFLLGGGTVEEGEGRREALARLLTSDPQFARNIVNRVWQRLMVVGLVEPIDDWDFNRLDPDTRSELGTQTHHPELINQLAAEFVAHGYDLWWLIETIATSDAYAMSTDHPEWRPRYAAYFARRLPRRLTAEEMVDAIVQAAQRPARHYVAGRDQPVRWARQLPGVWEPNLDAYDRGLTEQQQYDLDWDTWGMLQVFGRGNNYDRARSNDGSISQALSAMNSILVNRRGWLDDPATEPNRIQRLLAHDATPRHAVEELYLGVLSRYPTHRERQVAEARLEQDMRTGLEDLFWALVNTQEFLFRP